MTFYMSNHPDIEGIVLLGCPFCGGVPQYFRNEDWASIYCIDCGAHTAENRNYQITDREKAVMTAVWWNKRTSDTQKYETVRGDISKPKEIELESRVAKLEVQCAELQLEIKLLLARCGHRRRRRRIRLYRWVRV